MGFCHCWWVIGSFLWPKFVSSHRHWAAGSIRVLLLIMWSIKLLKVTRLYLGLIIWIPQLRDSCWTTCIMIFAPRYSYHTAKTNAFQQNALTINFSFPASYSSYHESGIISFFFPPIQSCSTAVCAISNLGLAYFIAYLSCLSIERAESREMYIMVFFVWLYTLKCFCSL